MIKKILLIPIIVALGAFAAEAACDVRVGVGPIEGGDDVAPAIEQQLQLKLQKALVKQGIVADGVSSRFYLTGRFDASYSDLVGGGTANRYVVKTDLTLYIADINGQVYATNSIELKGVGDTEERAYQKCLNSLNTRSTAFSDFVNEAKSKIIRYYDDNYKTYLKYAESAIAQRNYAEAMYYAGSIPECCKGFDAAQEMLLKSYRDYTNYDAQTLLAKAQAAWGANPNEYGAAEALGYLAAIDPAASCYPEALKLTSTITKQVRSDFEYETRTKREQEISLEKSRIEAAKAIGVAYGNHQPNTVYKNNYIVPRYY